jgi:alpha-glucosidase
VHIYDTAQKNYQIPPSVIARPQSRGAKLSDLEFHFTSYPFEFWITRRGAKAAPPLFDTRAASIPTGFVSQPVVPDDQSTVLNAFPLVFEDQYLQVPPTTSHTRLVLNFLFGS